MADPHRGRATARWHGLRWWAAAALLLVGLAWLGLHVLRLGFSESLYPTRGSFAFFVTITEPVIRDFPSPDAVEAPVYHYGVGDGPKPPDQSVSYRSRQPAVALEAAVLQHLRASGYGAEEAKDVKDAQDTSERIFVRGTDALYLYLAPAAGGHTDVEARLLLGVR